MDLKVVGENIKKYREQNNIPREVMAAELNMKPNAYGRIERGEVDLPLTRIDQIASVLKVGITQLLNLDGGQVFNISNTNNKVSIQGVSNNHHHSDNFKDKYIERLEKENERLKNELLGKVS